MSKRLIIFILIVVALVAALVLTNFGKNLPFSKWMEPVYTAEIPETRPQRLDQRLLERFEGEKMADILAVLAAEKMGTSATAGQTAAPDPDPLAQSLPDSPFPFDAESEPLNREWLTEFITSMKKNEGAKPTGEEIWRFNLALSALQISPDQLPASLRLNSTITPESDTMPVRLISRENAFTPPFTVGNFDGGEDVEVLDRGGIRISKISGSNDITEIEGHGIIFAGSQLYPADFDTDGDLDLFLIRPEGFPNSLLRNDGDGHFEDVTIELGLLSFNDTTAAAWIDYDGDGLLDLLVGSENHPLQLFHQTIGGSFQPIAWDLKLWIHRGVREIEVTDFSGDGTPDIFLGLNDQPDRLLLTKKGPSWKDWRFEDIMAPQQLSDSPDQSLTPFDFNHDGAPDLISREPTGNGANFRVLQNTGTASFEDVTAKLGFSEVENVTAIAIIDVDQDGFDDLFLGTPALSMNRLFWNRAGVDFREMSITTRAGFLDRPSKALVMDVNRNGINDLFYEEGGRVRWLEPSGSTSSWLQILLTKSMPGCRIVLTVRDNDWVLNSLSYELGNEASLSLGVGEAEVIEKLELFAPDRETVLFELEEIAPNQSVLLNPPSSPKPRATAPLQTAAKE
ncbi:MAG: VCBS repeat-containing protein [Verrucomicrobiales bacterium]|nr:VCBS repeat-containing protein [Verrucomicrobiales bacterium]